MKKLLLALALLLPFAAHAQTTLGPTGDLGADWSVPVTDFSALLGSAPADAYEPAEIGPQGYTESDWIDVGDSLGGNFVVTNDATREKKFRTTCANKGPILHQDFILGGRSHLHSPYGVFNWNGSSNYSTSRFNPSSTCQGGPNFSQIYIQPTLLYTDPTNGATRGVRDLGVAVYYVNGLQNETNQATWTRRDHQMIIGPNPMNYNDAARRAVYAAAGLMYPGSPETPAGFQGYYCNLGMGAGATVPVTLTKAQLQTPRGDHITTYAKYFWGSGASDDPWGGECKTVAGSPAVITGGLIAPGCWNRTQIKVPNGRDHMWYAGSSSDGAVVAVCPKTTSGTSFGKIPEPTFKFQIVVRGPADYKYLYYSSDRMNAAGTAADLTSFDECRKVSAYFCGGSTLHADWGFGAPSAIIDEFSRECLGITVRGVAPAYANGAECNTGVLSRYRALKTGTSPNSALSGGCTAIVTCGINAVPTNPKDYYLTVPGEKSGPTRVTTMPGM